MASGGREGVEALAAACAGGHVDKVVSLLAEGASPVALASVVSPSPPPSRAQETFPLGKKKDG